MNRRGLLIWVLLLSLSACSLFSGTPPANEPGADDDQDSKEVKSAVDVPENDLFQTAKANFSSRLFSVSREAWESLKNGYPLGPYLEYAQLKDADCYYEANDFDTCGPLYQEFVKEHPASDAAPYAALRSARCFQYAARGPGRNQEPLEKSLDMYNQFLASYPDSGYLLDAKAGRQEVVIQLAAHEKQVVDFYREHDKSAAAEARERAFKERWGQDINTVASISEKIEIEALPIERTLPARNVKISEFKPTILAAKLSGEPTASAANLASQVSTELLSDSAADKTGETEAANKIQAPEKLAAPVSSGGSNPSGQALASFVECNPTQGLITVYLKQTAVKGAAEVAAEVELPSRINALPRRDGRLFIRLAGISFGDRQGASIDCFGTKDLAFSSGGLVLAAPKAESFDVVSLGNPPRLVLARSAS